MSKRFGRNQRKKLLAQNASLADRLNHQTSRAIRAEHRVHGLREALRNARDVFLKIGWAADCDAVRMIDSELNRLDGRHHLTKEAHA